MDGKELSVSGHSLARGAFGRTQLGVLGHECYGWPQGGAPFCQRPCRHRLIVRGDTTSQADSRRGRGRQRRKREWRGAGAGPPARTVRRRVELGSPGDRLVPVEAQILTELDGGDNLWAGPPLERPPSRL